MKLNRTLLLVTMLAVILLTAGCGSKTHHLEMGGLNATDLLNNLVDKTTRVLGNVVSVDSAKAALPQLKEVNEGYDQLIDEVKGLSPAGRAEISEQAARAMPGLKDNARRMNSKNGIDEILGPEMNLMVTKLTKLL